jgi:hypothetical protein
MRRTARMFQCSLPTHARMTRSLGDAGRAGVNGVLGQCAQFGTSWPYASVKGCAEESC